jgi:hypothetical protein
VAVLEGPATTGSQTALLLGALPSSQLFRVVSSLGDSAGEVVGGMRIEAVVALTRVLTS